MTVSSGDAEFELEFEFEFEIQHKDLLGRTGRFRTGHGYVETPTIMPVINPNLMTVKPGEMRKYGAEMVITNAYIIYKNEELRAEALKRGIHAMLGTEMPVMTDSGAYQLSEYSDVEVSNREILRFQQRIGSDICAPLDIPTPPRVSRERARRDLEETQKRLTEARELIRDRLLTGVVQGSTYSDLRESGAKHAVALGFDIYGIGGVVPLLESYQFATLVDIIMAVKRNIPPNAPIHLFGAGHPMLFALAVALGCDIFDSAAYAIYAKSGRYITNEGTKRVQELQFLPCSCPVCSTYTVDEVRSSVDLLSEHNLWVTFEEMQAVKQSVVEGSLWELCERRCRAHPALLAALKRVTRYSALIERYDPVTKHPFFYLSECSAHRPEVLRYSHRLDRFLLSGNVLLSTSKRLMEGEERFDHLFMVKPPFGPYPVELEESYPVGQAELPGEEEMEEEEAERVALANVLRLLRHNAGKASFVFRCDHRWARHPQMEEIRKYARVEVR